MKFSFQHKDKVIIRGVEGHPEEGDTGTEPEAER